MPNDAKFGLVVGVGLVIAVAVVFFRKDLPGPKAALPEPKAAAAATQPAPPEAPLAASQPRVTPAQTAGLRREPTPDPVDTHVIADGDTLFTIAQKHYGDGDRFFELYQANRDVLKSPDRLPVGATLKVPR
jgi:nucleoid-associated protein YgaU